MSSTIIDHHHRIGWPSAIIVVLHSSSRRDLVQPPLVWSLVASFFVINFPRRVSARAPKKMKGNAIADIFSLFLFSNRYPSSNTSTLTAARKTALVLLFADHPGSDQYEQPSKETTESVQSAHRESTQVQRSKLTETRRQDATKHELQVRTRTNKDGHSYEVRIRIRFIVVPYLQPISILTDPQPSSQPVSHVKLFMGQPQDQFWLPWRQWRQGH